MGNDRVYCRSPWPSLSPVIKFALSHLCKIGVKSVAGA
jgi:hypothetical protein